MIKCQGHAAQVKVMAILSNYPKYWSSAYFVYNYLNKRKDDNEFNSCKLVADWLIVVLLLFTSDEYQGHVAQIEVITM